MTNTRSMLAILAIAAACTSSDTIQHRLSGLNETCSSPTDCPADLTCGAEGGESAGQCVVEGCPSAGPGALHGCPADAFCYVFDGDEGQYCTHVCETDAECAQINPNLVCRERSSTEDFDLKICVLEDPVPLNRSCASDDDCTRAQTCGTDGESAGQCVIEGCLEAGPGIEAGCPAGAFCYVFDGDEGHYCTQTCTDDIQCQLVNPSLICSEVTATEQFGLKICILGT